MKDFTLKKYHFLLKAFIDAGYHFQTFENFIENQNDGKTIILRHDVDKKPDNSLAFARIENSLDIKASYYFRIVPQSNDPEIIKKIVELGHELGYHYEDLSACKGDFDKAKTHFEIGLDYFRKFYPVKTICMHGSPLSKIDNRDIWKYLSYKNYGIIGEPYFDINFDKVFYVTDTGRCWGGEKFSVRDKVKTSFTQSYHSTDDIIYALASGSFPEKCMMTTHPQRWTDDNKEWFSELISQKIKNIVKFFMQK